MAQEFLKLLPLQSYRPFIGDALTSQTNICTNGTMQGGPGFPTNWTGVGAPGATITGDPGIQGNWYQITAPDSGLRTTTNTVTGGGGPLWSDGDVLALSASLSLSNASAGGWQRFSVKCQPSSSTFLAMYDTGTGSTAALRAWAFDYQRLRVYCEFVVPAGTTSVVITEDSQGGASTYRFGEVSLVNLTANGAVNPGRL